jgi:hypothetical protein
LDNRETKKGQIAPQRLKGFRDLLPQAMFVRQHVIDTLRHIFELHGFDPFETVSRGTSLHTKTNTVRWY